MMIIMIFRKTVRIEQGDVLQIDKMYGFNPHLSPIKSLYDQGKVAVINGIGYDNPNRSHFRSMDIWHTALPDEIGSEGWLGRVDKRIGSKIRKCFDWSEFWTWTT